MVLLPLLLLMMPCHGRPPRELQQLLRVWLMRRLLCGRPSQRGPHRRGVCVDLPYPLVMLWPRRRHVQMLPRRRHVQMLPGVAAAGIVAEPLWPK